MGSPGQSDTKNSEWKRAGLPVLVYRTPDMTDEQARTIQDFVHTVMSERW